jgi:hypothetical protein
MENRSIGFWFHLVVSMLVVSAISHIIFRGLFQWNIIVSTILAIIPVWTYMDFMAFDGRTTKPVIRTVAVWLYSITEKWNNT